MPDTSTATAISAALNCDWVAAIAANTKILKITPTDIDCLNRLGKAYLEVGDAKKAATFFRKVLKIDKYNPIAAKNLARAQDNKPTKLTGQPKPTAGQATSNANFLEEPGKTRLVTLVNVAGAAILARQDHADSLTLIPKRHTVVIEDTEGNYLGALPDDLGHRLGVLIKGGNRYEAITKSVTKNSITIFIRETCRAKKFHNTPSFLASSTPDYLSFLREDASPDEAKVTSADTEEEGDSLPNHHQDEEPETP